MADRVILILEGRMPERFLNRAMEEGACFLRLRRLSRRTLEITASPASARIVLDLAERYRLNCRVVGRGGLSALLPHLKKRATFPAAVLTFAALTALFLTRVWRVDVRMTDGSVPPEIVRELLTASGAEAGCKASDVNSSLLSLQIEALEGCSHASVARRGVVLDVRVTPELPAPELYDRRDARDLVAACDGVIASVQVKSGTALVKPGDVVRRGQTLIAGSERSSGEETSPIGALGRVTARVWCVGEAEEDLCEEVKHFTGQVGTSSYLELFGLSLPLRRGQAFDSCETDAERVAIGGLFLPLFLVRETYREYELFSAERDLFQTEEVARAEAEARAEQLRTERGFQDAQVLDRWTSLGISGGQTLTAKCIIEMQTEIAVTRGYLEEY